MDEAAVKVFLDALGEELDRIDQYIRDNLVSEDTADAALGSLAGAWALAHWSASLHGVKPYKEPAPAA